MKKYIINNFLIWLGYFVFLVVVNSMYSFSYWPLYIGGLVGLFIMPNLDHLLYVFVFKPQELTSQRIIALVHNSPYKDVLRLLYDTADERIDLIFHTPLFQIIFAVLTFWVVTSSGNLFARGLVLSFMLSLSIYNYKKYKEENKNLFYGLVLALFIFGILL